MDDDPIVDGLAVALEAIEEHAGEPRYADPALAAWIDSVKDAMAALQAYLTDPPDPA